MILKGNNINQQLDELIRNTPEDRRNAVLRFAIWACFGDIDEAEEESIDTDREPYRDDFEPRLMAKVLRREFWPDIYEER